MSAPRVTVIIPAYRRADALPRAVRSVQAQTFGDWELIVVDDASGDETASVAEGLGDARLRVIRHTTNRGPGAARQTALEAARGEWIALLDSDDEWLPEKLALQLAAGAPVVGCGYHARQGEEEWTFLHPAVADWVEELHLRCMLRAGSTLLVRREIALEAGGFDAGLRYYEDWDFALRLAKRLKVLDEPLVRIHVGPPRSMVAAEPFIRRFLEKHDAAFRERGAAHRRRVRGQHLQNLAAGAFAGRQFALGARWLVESYVANPMQNPLRLAALALAPVDALLGTSLIERAAARRRFDGGDARPAP
jgi:glycosyltransferase involved in cell wall biosynthesis